LDSNPKPGARFPDCAGRDAAEPRAEAVVDDGYHRGFPALRGSADDIYDTRCKRHPPRFKSGIL
jgi:hypothetical protein